MRQIRILVLACIVVTALASACGTNVTLDNPSTETAVVVIDGSEEHSLGAGERVEISLGAGSHKVSVKRDGSGFALDTTINVKEGGVLHTCAEPYVIWRQLYGVQTDRERLLNEDWVMVDSTRYFGDIKISPANGLYIEQDWTMGLAQEMPESQALYVTKDFKVESKVFRQSEFVETYRRMSEQNKKSK